MSCDYSIRIGNDQYFPYGDNPDTNHHDHNDKTHRSQWYTYSRITTIVIFNGICMYLVFSSSSVSP